jgi:CBS domain-containing protein
MHQASLAAEQQAMGRTLRSLIQRPPVTCAADTTVREALRAMKSAGVGSIVVTAPDGAPTGIFTRYDVLDRIALPGRGLDGPVAEVMTPAPRTLTAEANAYDAALLIAQRGIRHVPVVDGGRLIGVVTERDLFALQRIGIRAIHRTINDAAEHGQLRQAAADVRALVVSLIRLGSAAEPLTQIVSTLNDALTRRILEIEQQRRPLDGITWGWLGFGSEGRYEQTISTDQDNGIIFVVPPGESADGARSRLLPFARAVNQALAACGFPLCAGDIMAGNPRWCLSLDEWLRRFDGWITDSSPQALLDAAIFFDFRLLHGDERLAETLRERLLALAAGTPRFLRQMAEQAVAVRPPLGTFNDFVTEESADGRATLDLKLSGSRIIVDAARIMALAQGVAHTGTVERLRQAGHRLGMNADETGSAVEAFFFIQMLRLRHQMAAKEGASPNRIAPAELNEVDRRMLKESLRQARKLQTRLALDYAL